MGLGHGNLAKMLLSEATECFCFLAGHESFAAAEGAISIALNANKVRQKPLRVILNGLGKDAAYIISRINGFTYVKTEFDNNTETLKVVGEVPSQGPPAAVRCYGADNVPRALRLKQGVGVSITGSSTSQPVQHRSHDIRVVCRERRRVFLGRLGRQLNRTLHPDNAAGPSSYSMTHTTGRMHSDAWLPTSSVPAHVQ